MLDQEQKFRTLFSKTASEMDFYMIYHSNHSDDKLLLQSLRGKKSKIIISSFESQVSLRFQWWEQCILLRLM